MPDSQEHGGNTQTICYALEELHFEAIEQTEGYATVVRFRVQNQEVKIGDVLLVLEGAEIRFHGMIGRVDEGGWAVAVDRRGSTLPASHPQTPETAC